MPKAKSNEKPRGWNKKVAALFIFLIAVIVFLLAYIFFSLSDKNKTSEQRAIPDYDHIFVIIEENHSDKSIVGNPEASFINSMINNYSYANRYFASTHPSLPNYMILTEGKNPGVWGGCSPSLQSCRTKDKNLLDVLEAHGKSWKAYFEDMPEPCAFSSTNLYDIDYNPFIYYEDIASNEDRCDQHVVPLANLQSDIKSSDGLANLIFISPNKCNDMHDCSVRIGDKWLATMVTELLDSPAFSQQKSLLVVTWDESERNNINNVPMILAGSSVKHSYQSNNRYDHLSLLKTIEAAWQLPALNPADRNAQTMSEFFE